MHGFHLILKAGTCILYQNFDFLSSYKSEFIGHVVKLQWEQYT